MTELSNVDRKILTRIQEDFPLVIRPFKALGESLNITENEALMSIQKMKKLNMIRQINAIFDTRSMGYQSSLVAAKAESYRIRETAEVINEHPGVTHNYRRNHEFNLWFTIAVSPESSMDLEKTVDLIGHLSKVESIRVMPTLKLYKIGVTLDMNSEVNLAKSEQGIYNEAKVNREPLSKEDIRLILELQEDLELTLEPFKIKAQNLGFSEERLFKGIKNLVERGKMRRFAAILNHRRAGFMANAMGVWKVPLEKIDEMGAKMAAFKAVSHCYRRPTYPDWPYPLFSMVHGKNEEECEKILKVISEETGLMEYQALYSSTEYKKTRVKYFSPEFEAWEKKYAPLPVQN
ncbi:MAG: Lrp/AsnC family transcriptional regulator [Chlamydiae bacterium]|nr:Lrp/AsnC family transcriptional regulator [Chlamydiota bacterium]MBI3277074.1 Lrp/AsnC family transcriptional regulator [Chlamydiota bacterium]